MLQEVGSPADVDMLCVAGCHWLVLGMGKGFRVALSIRSSLRMKLGGTRLCCASVYITSHMRRAERDTNKPSKISDDCGRSART